MRTYLDHAASTPVRPEVAALIVSDLADPSLPAVAANPAAAHASGRAGAAALLEARSRVGAALGADTHEVLLTASGTEADALVIAGRVLAARKAGVSRPAVVISALEHAAVADSARTAQQWGAQVVTVPLRADGRTDPADVAAAVSAAGVERTAVVSVMAASNETGAVQDIAGIVSAVRALSPGARPGGLGWVCVHTDAVAAASVCGCQEVSARAWDVDALSVSGHKLGAPVGTGALVLGRHVALSPPTGGGRQERGLRSGTQDVLGARALALALELAGAQREAEAARLEELRTRLLAGATAIPGVHATLPDDVPHLPGTAHLWCEDADGESLLMAVDLAGVDVSAGAACHAGVWRPSAAVLAMGLGEAAASATVRVSMGPGTSAQDVDRLLEVLPAALDSARRVRRL